MLKRVPAFLLLMISPAWAEPLQCTYAEGDLDRVTPAGWTVTMPGRAPLIDGEAGFQYAPETTAAAFYLDGSVGSTETQVMVEHEIWVPRVDTTNTLKPNPFEPHVQVGGIDCGVKYSTPGFERASFLAQAAYTIGRGPNMPHGTPFHNGWQDPINYFDQHHVMTVMSHAQIVANAATLCTNTDPSGSGWKFMWDVVPLPDVRLVDLTVPKLGILLDWEPHGCGFSGIVCVPSNANADLTWLVANVHQKLDPNGQPYNFTVGLYNNPLNGGAFFKNGLDPNTACQIVDQCGLYTASSNGDAATQLNAELALVPDVPRAKLYWQFDPLVPSEQLSAAHNLAANAGLSGVMAFADGVTTCSPQWNVAVGAALGIAQ